MGDIEASSDESDGYDPTRESEEVDGADGAAAGSGQEQTGDAPGEGDSSTGRKRNDRHLHDDQKSASL